MEYESKITSTEGKIYYSGYQINVLNFFFNFKEILRNFLNPRKKS